MSSTSSSFIPQFLSKNVWSILGMTALFHVLAAVVLHSMASAVVLGGVFLGVLAVTSKRLEWGLCIALFEIVIGAHGHLVTLAYNGVPLSLRMVVFAAVMLGWLWGLFQKKWTMRFLPQRDVPFLILMIAVLYGVVRGLVMGQGMGALIDDANSYVTLLYALPLASVVWSQEHRRLMLTTLFSGVLWVSLFTLALTYIFTHISQEHIWDMYVLVRDTRMFEVTLLSSPAFIANHLVGGDWYFRVFSQAQIFAPLYILILVSALLFLRTGKSERVPRMMWVWFACLFAAFLQSLSRSFLVGFGAGAFALFGFWLLGGRSSWQTWGTVAKRKAGILVSFLGAAALLWVLVSSPFPSRPDLSNSPFYRGDQDNVRALAVSSRWNMLPPLWEALREQPFLGQGFGDELTYISDDPRIREMTGGTGELTTYRFEWGFLDVWLKMGVVGLFAYFWIFWSLVSQVFRNVRSLGLWSFAGIRERWLEIGLVSGVVMLFATHMFTPYLNHPIGLFFLLLVAFLLEWKRPQTKKEMAEEKSDVKSLLVKMPLGVSVRVK